MSEPLPEEMPHRSRKNTARWCKGKVGREHTPELVVRAYSHPHECKPVGPFRNDTERFWSCAHVHRCTGCSKVLSALSAADCPDRPADLRPWAGWPAYRAELREQP